jgi:hypothetical protein
MNLRCVFHVTPLPPQAKPLKPEDSPPPADKVEVVQEPPRPRGRSFETWSRARGWASED